MTAQRFRGPVLPDGEARDLYVVGGRITYEPQAGADTVAEGWIVPGLVDAHCHLGPDDFGATDDAATEQQAIAAGHGVLPGLIEAGIDCIEHGTGLTEDLIDAMVRHGTRLVPTVMQLDKFPEHAAAGQERFPAYADTMVGLYDRMPATIMAAYEAGVPIYAGSDGGGISRHGNIAGEIEALVRIGMPAHDALGAASWRAREWLGVDGLVEGASADFVVYDRDPRADLSVLRAPTAIVLRGDRVGVS